MPSSAPFEERYSEVRHLEDRVLVFAPSYQDASVTRSFLKEAGIIAEGIPTLLQLTEAITDGCGVVVLAEETLGPGAISHLQGTLSRQPSWSEIPIILITSTGEASRNLLQQLRLFGPTTNISLLERPFRPITLVNTVRAAMRSRERQYEVRDLLEERETVLKSINDAFLILDADWTITYVNEKGAEIAQKSVVEMLGAPFWEVFPRLVDSVVERELKQAFLNQQFTHFEFHDDETARWFDLRIYPSPKGISLLAAEITERKKVEEDLRAAKERLGQLNQDLEKRVQERTSQLTETNEQLEAFVYSIAHDLRAPLRAMQGYSSLLRTEYASQLDASAQLYADRIIRSAESMDRLVIDLLAYGRVARAELQLAPVELEKAWSIALNQCQQEILSQEAKVETLGPLPRVQAHETTLGQVLLNLLNNAIKFVPPGRKPHVRLSAQQIKNQVRVTVEDNGIGIEPNHQQRVFRVFERLNGTDYPGTGIGLSIVRKGVERMGGKVGLESTPGQGSRFWIELPSA